MLENEGADSAPVEDVAASPEPAAEPTEATETTDEAAPSIDDELRAIYAKNNRERGPDGRFAAKDSDQSPTDGDGKPQEPAAIPVPVSWSAEVKEKWASLPSDVQALVAKREQEASAKISQQGQQLKSYEPFNQVLEQARATFGRYGIDEGTGFAQLLQANEYLERDARSAIRDLAKAYGVEDVLSNGRAAPQNAIEASLRAELAEVRRHLQETSNRVTGRERAEQMREAASLETQIAAFAKDKTDFAELEDEIEQEIIVLKQRSPDLPATELLAKAYERAKWANPDARAKALEAEEKAKEAKRLEEAKKRSHDAKRIAPLGVKSSTANSSAPRSMEDTMREVYRRAASR